jgi:predicted RNase H-like HicB family nuclease
LRPRERTEEEAIEMLIEAVELYLEDSGATK